MKQDTRIYIAHRKKISCYDENRLAAEWTLDLGKRIYRIGKHQDMVLVQTYSIWGIPYLHAIGLTSGELLWSMKTSLTSTLIIHEGTIYFVDYQNKIHAVSQADGQLLFKVRAKGLWHYAKLTLINNRLYFYSGKNYALVDFKTGALSYGRSPQGIDLKGVTIIHDSHQLVLTAGRAHAGSASGGHPYVRAVD